MALIHSDIILTRTECNFIPTKYCSSRNTIVSTDVVEGLTFEQEEMKFCVWNFTGSCNTFFVFVLGITILLYLVGFSLV